MRRTAPPSNPHAHEHEFRVIEDDSAFFYEDGALFVTERCDYIEQRSAGHSKRLDETFYETMYECETERTHRFDLVSIEHKYVETEDTEGYLRLADGADELLTLYDEYPTLFEEIERAAAQRLCDDGDAIDFTSKLSVDHSDHQITVEVDDEQYRLTYEFTEVKRI
jgi:hypothetical protein